MLKKLRMAKGYTQREFAKMVKVTETAISYWENKKRIPSAKKMRLISEVLEVNVEIILDFFAA